MKNILLLFVTLSTTFSSFCQTISVGQYIKVTANGISDAQLYGGQNTDIYTIPINSKLLVKKIVSTGYLVQIISCDKKSQTLAGTKGVVSKNYLYIISNNDVIFLEIKNVGIVKWDNLGALTIPFKFDPKTSQIYPGASLGIAYGPRLLFTKNSDAYLSLIGFAGLSAIPTNNLNSNASSINTVSGVTFGGGLVFNIQAGFQLGIIYGQDKYNANNQSVNQNWVSFSVGYSFLANTVKTSQ